MDEHDKQTILRHLPSIDALLHSPTAEKISIETGKPHLTTLARKTINSLRHELSDKQNGNTKYSRQDLLTIAETRLESAWQNERNTGLRAVVWATPGVCTVSRNF